MKYYYKDDYATIFLGDCREILPSLPDFDLVLTDPPYGIDENSNKQKTRGRLTAVTDYGDFNWDKEAPSKEFLDMIRSKGEIQVIFGGNFFELPPTSCFFVWDKDNGTNDFADCELAWSNLKSATRLKRYRWNGMLQENMQDKEQRVHPTQKPLSVLQWILNIVMKKHEIKSVLDPFMGSGSVLRMCKNNLIHSVGIDKEERYCEIAAKRLSQEVLSF